MTSPFQTLGLHPFLIEQLTPEQIPTVAEGAQKGLQLAFHTDIQQGEDHQLSSTINTNAELLSTPTNAEEYRTQYLRDGPGQATVRAAEQQLRDLLTRIAGAEKNLLKSVDQATRLTGGAIAADKSFFLWFQSIFSGDFHYHGDLFLTGAPGTSFSYVPRPFFFDQEEYNTLKSDLQGIDPTDGSLQEKNITVCSRIIRDSLYWLKRCEGCSFDNLSIEIKTEIRLQSIVDFSDDITEHQFQLFKHNLTDDLKLAESTLRKILKQKARTVIARIKREINLHILERDGHVDDNGMIVLDGQNTGLMVTGVVDVYLDELDGNRMKLTTFPETDLEPFFTCHAPKTKMCYALVGIDENKVLHPIVIVRRFVSRDGRSFPQPKELVDDKKKSKKSDPDQEFDYYLRFYDPKHYSSGDAEVGRYGNVSTEHLAKYGIGVLSGSTKPAHKPISTIEDPKDSSQSQPSDQPDTEQPEQSTALTKAKGVQVQYKRNPFEVIGVLPSLLQQLSEDQLKLHIKHLVKAILAATHPESPTPNPELYVEVNAANQQLDNPKTFKQAYAEYKDSKPGKARAQAILELKDKEAEVIPALVKKLAELKQVVASRIPFADKLRAEQTVFLKHLGYGLFDTSPNPEAYPSALYLHHSDGVNLSVTTPSGPQQFTIERRAYDVFAVSDSTRIRLLGSSVLSFKGTTVELQQNLDSHDFLACVLFAHPILYPGSHLIGFVEDKDKLQVLGTIEDIQRAKATARKIKKKDRKPETGHRTRQRRRTK